MLSGFKLPLGRAVLFLGSVWAIALVFLVARALLAT
jgi:hypothetical protein